MVTKQPNFDIILDDCIARIQAGATIEACMSAYPQHAERLRSPLMMATALQGLPIPQARSQAVADGQQRMLDAVEQTWVERHEEKSSILPVSFGGLLRYARRGIHSIFPKEKPMLLALRSAIALLVMFVISGTMATSAAADTLPGDSLYPVKRAWENTRLFLTVDEETQQELEEELANERIQEIQALIGLGRQETVTFAGELLAMDNQTWQIGGLLVQFNDNTEIDGTMTLGWKVEVRARIQNDGTLKALRAHVQTGPEGPHHSPYPGPGSTRTPRPSSTHPPSATQMPGQKSTSMPGPGHSASSTPKPRPIPHNTAMPGHTPKSMPTHTCTPMPMPTHTCTPMPMPTTTSMPMPTNTSMPMATRTPQQTPMASHTPRHK
jgi:hypothetical protein